MPTYIGNREIKSFTAVGDGSFVEVEYADGFKSKMSGTLFFHLQKDVAIDGNVTDHINHYFATKFLAELATHELDYYFVQNVATAMGVLAHNLREAAIKKAFNCSGGDAIPLQLLIPEDIDENVEVKEVPQA